MLIYKAFRIFVWFCFNILGRIEITGKENIPKDGPLIVIGNHMSYNDPLAIALAIWRILHSLGKKELFSHPIIAFCMKQLGVQPLDRSASSHNGLKAARKLLSEGRAILIYPEGTRSKTFQLQKAENGVTLLVKHTGVSILPVGVVGTEKLPTWRILLPHRTFPFQVHIGELITAETLESKGTREAQTTYMMKKVAALLPKECRGVYALSNSNVEEGTDVFTHSSCD